MFFFSLLLAADVLLLVVVFKAIVVVALEAVTVATRNFIIVMSARSCELGIGSSIGLVGLAGSCDDVLAVFVVKGVV